MRTTLLAFLAASLSFAQSGPPNPLPTNLSTYLDLTAGQTARLMQNRVELQRFLNEKSRREAVVRAELAVETRKPVLDPMALGLRYLELEAICRESNAAQEKNRTDNLAVLTDAQRTKLRGLDDVLRLLPVVYEAQAANLMPGGGLAIPLLGGGNNPGIGQIPGIADLIGGLRNGPGCSAGGFGGIIGIPGLGGLIGGEQKDR